MSLPRATEKEATMGQGGVFLFRGTPKMGASSWFPLKYSVERLKIQDTPRPDFADKQWGYPAVLWHTFAGIFPIDKQDTNFFCMLIFVVSRVLRILY